MTKKVTSEQAQQELANAERVRSLNGHAGWEVLKAILSSGIDNAHNRLLSPDCEWDEVRMLRDRIGWLKTLIKTPEISNEEFTAWKERVAHLKERERIRKDLGMVPNQEDPRREVLKQSRQGR